LAIENLGLKDREYRSYVETSDGEVAVRAKISDFDGDININSESTSVNTNGLTGKPSNGDFITSYNTSNSITCSGLPSTIANLTSADIVSITQVANDGSRTIYFGDDNKFIVSGNVISVDGASFVSTDSFIIQTNINDVNAYDSSTNTEMTTVLNPVWDRYTDSEELVSAQDLTSSYVDFGSEIDLRGYSKLVVGVIKDVNDSQDVDMKILGKTVFGGTDEYDIDSIPVERLWSGAGSDGKTMYVFDITGIPVVQVQAKAGVAGATPGNLTINIMKVY